MEDVEGRFHELRAEFKRTAAIVKVLADTPLPVGADEAAIETHRTARNEYADQSIKIVDEMDGLLNELMTQYQDECLARVIETHRGVRTEANRIKAQPVLDTEGNVLV